MLITFVRFNEGLNQSSITYLLLWELYVLIISVNYGYENILKQKWNVRMIIMQNNENDMFLLVPTTTFERDYANDLQTLW